MTTCIHQPGSAAIHRRDLLISGQASQPCRRGHTPGSRCRHGCSAQHPVIPEPLHFKIEACEMIQVMKHSHPQGPRMDTWMSVTRRHVLRPGPGAWVSTGDLRQVPNEMMSNFHRSSAVQTITTRPRTTARAINGRRSLPWPEVGGGKAAWLNERIRQGADSIDRMYLGGGGGGGAFCCHSGWGRRLGCQPCVQAFTRHLPGCSQAMDAPGSGALKQWRPSSRVASMRPFASCAPLALG